MSKELDDLMEAVGMQNRQLQDRSAVVQGIFKEQDETAKDMSTQQQTAGDNNLIVTRAKEVAALTAQDQTNAQATKMGINPADASEVLDAVSKEWKSATLDAIAKRNKLKDDLEVKFLDHPVDYIKAQMNMQDTVTQAEAAAARRTEATQSFSAIQTLTQQLPGQMAALAKTRSAATVQATLEGTAAELNAKLDKTKIENYGIQVQGLQTLNNMSAAQVNNLSTAFSAKSSAEHLELAKNSFALQKKAFEATQEDRLERIEQKKADRQELEDTANLVRKGAAAAGFKEVAAFPTQKIISMINSKQANVIDFYKAGMTSEAVGHPVLADNPGDTARILAQHSAPLLPEQKTVKDFFNHVWLDAGSPDAGLKGRYDATKVDQVTKAAGALATSRAVEQMGNIKPGDSSNIYAPPPLQTVMETGPVKSSVWYTRVMAPQMVTGALKEFDPEQLISLTTKAIKSGAIGFNDAAVGLQAAFGSARLVNNLTKNYTGLGLPPQVGFNTTLPNGMGFIRKVNLDNTQEINNLLNSRLSTFSNVSGAVLNNRPFGLD